MAKHESQRISILVVRSIGRLLIHEHTVRVNDIQSAQTITDNIVRGDGQSI